MSVLIISVNSCNVCVFYSCVFSNKLALFKATYIYKNLHDCELAKASQMSYFKSNCP